MIGNHNLDNNIDFGNSTCVLFFRKSACFEQGCAIRLPSIGDKTNVGVNIRS